MIKHKPQWIDEERNRGDEELVPNSVKKRSQGDIETVSKDQNQNPEDK